MSELKSVANNLIDNMPAILTALAAVVAALTSFLANTKAARIEAKAASIEAKQTQMASDVNGHMSEMKGALIREAAATAKLEAFQEQKVEKLLAEAQPPKGDTK